VEQVEVFLKFIFRCQWSRPPPRGSIKVVIYLVYARRFHVNVTRNESRPWRPQVDLPLVHFSQTHHLQHIITLLYRLYRNKAGHPILDYGISLTGPQKILKLGWIVVTTLLINWNILDVYNFALQQIFAGTLVVGTHVKWQKKGKKNGKFRFNKCFSFPASRVCFRNVNCCCCYLYNSPKVSLLILEYDLKTNFFNSKSPVNVCFLEFIPSLNKLTVSGGHLISAREHKRGKDDRLSILISRSWIGVIELAWGKNTLCLIDLAIVADMWFEGGKVPKKS